jgi:hypothetical protein
LTPTETTSCALETSPENDAFLVCASISPPAFTLASPSLEAGRSEGEGGRGDPPVEPELSSNPIFPTTSSSESSFLVAAGGSARKGQQDRRARNDADQRRFAEIQREKRYYDGSLAAAKAKAEKSRSALEQDRSRLQQALRLVEQLEKVTKHGPISEGHSGH